MVAPRATSLRRGTEILIALGSDEAVEHGGLGVVRIAELVGREKSQVSRALSALAANGMVDRDPASRAYRPGLAAVCAGRTLGPPAADLVGRPGPAGLVAESGETAHLSVLQGGEVMTLLSEAPAYAITANGWTGRTVPVICTSAGRALLFDHDLPTLERLVGSARFTGLGPGAPRDVTGALSPHRGRARPGLRNRRRGVRGRSGRRGGPGTGSRWSHPGGGQRLGAEVPARRSALSRGRGGAWRRSGPERGDVQPLVGRRRHAEGRLKPPTRRSIRRPHPRRSGAAALAPPGPAVPRRAAEPAADDDGPRRCRCRP